jgi:hypothetical protein
MNGKRRLLGSFNHGTMACALPLAIGAQTVNRDRQVVAFAGDGGLTMLFGELITLVQNRLPVKLIVFNNSSLNFVELEMKAAGIVTFGTDLKNPDFAAVAEALGLFARRVEHPADLESALEAALAYDRPSGTVDPAGHHRRAGKGLLAVRDPHHHGRARRRTARLDDHQCGAPHPGLRIVAAATFSRPNRLGCSESHTEKVALHRINKEHRGVPHIG